jgi:hypothetical protein
MEPSHPSDAPTPATAASHSERFVTTLVICLLTGGATAAAAFMIPDPPSARPLLLVVAVLVLQVPWWMLAASICSGVDYLKRISDQQTAAIAKRTAPVAPKNIPRP